jgi:hypothetical protein
LGDKVRTGSLSERPFLTIAKAARFDEIAALWLSGNKSAVRPMAWRNRHAFVPLLSARRAASVAISIKHFPMRAI